MKAFIDTNIIVSAISQQPARTVSQQVLDIIDTGQASGYISVGSFYTMIYLLDKIFKKDNIAKERRVALLQHIMDVVLEKFKIVEHEYLSLYLAVHDEKFNDMEDSCQYHAAIKAGCDVLVTENLEDFAHANGIVKVLSARDFVNLHQV